MSDEHDDLDGLRPLHLSKMIKQMTLGANSVNGVDLAMSKVPKIDWMNLGSVAAMRPNKNLPWLNYDENKLKRIFGGISSMANDNSLLKLNPLFSDWETFKGFEFSKTMMSASENSESWKKVYNISQTATHFDWKNNFPDSFFKVPKDLNRFYESFSSIQNNFANLNKSYQLQINDESLTIDDGLIASMNYDLENDKEPDITELEIIIEETNNFLIELTKDITKVYELFEYFIDKISKIKNFQTSKDLIIEYGWSIVITIQLITFKIENNLNIDSFKVESEIGVNNNNTTQTNSNNDNSVTNNYNYGNIIKIQTNLATSLKPTKDRRFKSCVDVPANSVLIVINIEKDWHNVRYIDVNGNEFVGFIHVKEIARITSEEKGQ
ncbi:hypothetical protein ABGT15_04610 [Flavobacterium enshiense]|uniref:hypothetical protein n=1 Tax=Flavobacterium enshiense TaxID=1341165 RepID=UPI00345CDAEB